MASNAMVPTVINDMAQTYANFSLSKKPLIHYLSTHLFPMAKTPRKKASKKGLILQKAATLFRQRGFAATSMRDLAEE